MSAANDDGAMNSNYKDLEFTFFTEADGVTHVFNEASGVSFSRKTKTEALKAIPDETAAALLKQNIEAAGILELKQPGNDNRPDESGLLENRTFRYLRVGCG